MGLELLRMGKSRVLDSAFNGAITINGKDPFRVIPSCSKYNKGDTVEMFPDLSNRGLGPLKLNLTFFREHNGGVVAQGFMRRDGANYLGFDTHVIVTEKGANAWIRDLVEFGDNLEVLEALKDVRPQLRQFNR